MNMTNRNTQTQHLLQLELDRRFDFDDFVAQVLGMADRSWELAGYKIRPYSFDINRCSKKKQSRSETHPWKDQGQGDEGSA
jgi:hypothetical protein